MFAVTGMLLFPASGDLLTMFVALEVLSLPLYLLCGLARRRRLLSQEAALKYFLLGAFSSGFFLYGVALVYGFAGSMDLAAIDAAVRNDTGNRALLLVGIGMLMVGLFFKVGAVPFHSWTPDVYQGAPTAVTAFMAAGTKVAAFGAILRLLYVAFGAERWSWQPMLWVVAILTMLVGRGARDRADRREADAGLLRDRPHRLPAHRRARRPERQRARRGPDHRAAVGAVLPGAPTASRRWAPSPSSRWCATPPGRRPAMARWAGLGRRSPIVAGAFAFFLLSMAGIPLTAGFTGKWAVFTVALAAGAWPVVLVAILASVLSVYFYVHLIRVMYFADARGRGRLGDHAVDADHRRHRRRRDRHPGARRGAGAGAGPGGRCRTIHQVSSTPPLANLALPVSDEALADPSAGAPRRHRGAAGRLRPGPHQVRLRGRGAPAGRRRQAVPPAAGAAGRRGRHGPGRRGRADGRLRRRDHAPGLALPRRRDGRGRAASRRRLRQRALGQPGRHPHRRLPLRPLLRADRPPGRRRRAHPGRDLHPPGRGPDPRDGRPRPRRGPAPALPRRGGRQDRFADRHLGPLRRPLQRRLARGRGGAGGVRRDRRLGLPALRRHPRRRLRVRRVRQDARHRPARGRGHAAGADGAGRVRRLRATPPTYGCSSCSTPTSPTTRCSPRPSRCCAPTRRWTRPAPTSSRRPRRPSATSTCCPPGPVRDALAAFADLVAVRTGSDVDVRQRRSATVRDAAGGAGGAAPRR